VHVIRPEGTEAGRASFGAYRATLNSRPEYDEHARLLMLFVIKGGLSKIGAFLSCDASAARAFRIEVPIFFTAMLVAAAGMTALVPIYSVAGGRSPGSGPQL
jgi:hypothetical protein